MTLKTYLASSGVPGAALARQLGVHPVLIYQWSNHKRPVPIEHCAAIEAATHGAVRRWDLRPTDWHRIWPELVGVTGAPVVSSSETQEV